MWAKGSAAPTPTFQSLSLFLLLRCHRHPRLLLALRLLPLLTSSVTPLVWKRQNADRVSRSFTARMDRNTSLRTSSPAFFLGGAGREEGGLAVHREWSDYRTARGPKSGGVASRGYGPDGSFVGGESARPHPGRSAPHPTTQPCTVSASPAYHAAPPHPPSSRRSHQYEFRLNLSCHASLVSRFLVGNGGNTHHHHHHPPRPPTLHLPLSPPGVDDEQSVDGVGFQLRHLQGVIGGEQHGAAGGIHIARHV